MRLIDADALVIHLADWQLSASSGQYSTIEEAIDAVAGAPTIDAVPVVRCKDCRWRNTIDCDAFVAAQSVYACEDDGFCKWAEREDND